MNFRQVKIEDINLFNSALSKENIGWEYDFATLFSWNSDEKMQIAENDGYFCIYNFFGDKLVFMPPYLLDKSKFLTAIDDIINEGDKFGINYTIRGLSKEQAEMLNGKYNLTTDRNEYDYIYKASDLKYLQGKAFHSKRNFITRFQKSYDYQIKEYDESDFQSVLALVDEWNYSSSRETMSYERRAIERALKFYKELGLKVFLLKDNDTLVAFSISHISPNGVAHTMFEKANTNYVGAYQAVNNFSANKFFNDNYLVNRQEDMGIEGLRKAKLSYSPTIILEKYKIEVSR
jgi:hypothetical protein